MKWSHRLSVSSVAALFALAVIGCSAGQSHLEGAVFASNVPVVEKATFDGQMGGTSYGEETSKSMSWFFLTERPMDEVVAFYEAKLTGWTRVDDSYGDNPTVTFGNTPENAEEGEYVQVIISKGKVQIHESYKPKRAKS